MNSSSILGIASASLFIFSVSLNAPSAMADSELSSMTLSQSQISSPLSVDSSSRPVGQIFSGFKPVTNANTVASTNSIRIEAGSLNGQFVSVATSWNTDLESLQQARRLAQASATRPVSISGKSSATNAVIGTGSPNAVIGTGSPNPNAVIGTGSPNAVIGTGSPNAVIGTGSPNAVIGTGSPNAVIGTGAARMGGNMGTQAVIGTGQSFDAVIGTGHATSAVIGTGFE